MKTHMVKVLIRINTEETIRSKLGSFRSLTTKSKVVAMVASNQHTLVISTTTTMVLAEVKPARENP